MNNKYKWIYILIFFVVLILIFIGVVLIKQKNSLNPYIEKILKTAEIPNGISYIVYDNVGEKIKSVVIIKKIDGIESVEYKKNEQTVVMHANNKQIVALDIEFQIGNIYSFKVISNGVAQIETINIDENYLDNCVKIGEASVDNAGNKKVEIKYNELRTGITKWYRIGEINDWQEYNGKIDITNIDYNDLNKETNLLNIYAKEIDDSGNVVIAKEEFNSGITFDVFRDVELSGLTLEEYGFTAEWDNSQNQWFEPWYIGAGHYTYIADYSGRLELNWTRYKNMKPSEIFIEFDRNVGEYGSWVRTGLYLRYKDGTTTSKLVQKNDAGYDTKSVTLLVDRNKEIDCLGFFIKRT